MTHPKQKLLNWIPEVSFKQLVEEMISKDFEIAKKEHALNKISF